MGWRIEAFSRKSNELWNSIAVLCFLTIQFGHMVLANEPLTFNTEYYRLCGEDLRLGLQSLCGSRYAETRKKRDEGTLGKQMNNFIEKRQTNTGIVEMCCYNEFGCSIETLSEFCEEGSIHRDVFLITHSHRRVMHVERVIQSTFSPPVSSTRPSITRIRGRPRHRDRARSHTIRPFLTATRKPHEFPATFLIRHIGASHFVKRD
ncbi:uncharacterized protein LOC125675794 [Ostrea edulis]|uniref:uncharacterized protein LOC125675794 n=1 Tax=Ostrea edulis TaxID=37623 RepID=UPI00209579A5|nr:uncharacterized protein LOC125675794 [Ostrea edulis]